MFIDERVSQEIIKRHQGSLQALGIMIGLSEKALDSGVIPNTDLAKISLFFLTRFHKTLQALRLLVISGFEEDSRVILRTMVEIMLSLAYISKKPDERVKLFVEYNHVERKRFLDKIDMHYPDERIEQDYRNKIVEDYLLVKDNYVTKSRWCDKNLSQVAAELGPNAIFWYDIIYGVDSSYVHSNIGSAKDLILEVDSLVNIVADPYPFNATDIISKATEITREILQQVLLNWVVSTEEIHENWEIAKELIVEEFKGLS